jgi:hypothetical protein
MKVLETEGGVLEPEDVDYFGGKYSLWEKIKKGGVGSPKTIYVSGIEAFDQLSHNVPGETGFASFELLKNGLIVRYHINLRYACVGIKLSDIEAIRLVAYWTGMPKKKWNTTEAHQGELEITEGQERLFFKISSSEFNYVLKYFQREELVDKLQYRVRENA